MQIKISHPKFSSVELRGETLIIHSMQDEARVLRENVKDIAVSVQGDQLRIVAFSSGNHAWFFTATEDFESGRIELGETYGGGGRLISDGLGNSHLFYFVKQSPGHSALLRHQKYTEEWSKPQTVSTNVFLDDSSFSVSWHDDHYLHLVYLAHKDQPLLYRVYNLEHGIWSGAISFSEARCSHPQLISAGGLYVFWQEDGEQIDLKVKEKEQNWSSASLVSSGEHHASNVGYAFFENQWSVFWVEGSVFYQAPFGKWSQRQEISRADYEYNWVVYEGLTIPVYEPLPVSEPASEPVPVQTVTLEKQEQPESTESTKPAETTEVDERALLEAQEREREQKRRQSEEAKLQAAFIEKAFQTLQEWEKVQEKMEKWQREFKLPEPVDLTPLTTRVERLERRSLTIKQSHDQAKKEWENSSRRLEEELVKTRARLRELEDAEKRRPPSLWQRVLGRV